MKIDEVINHLIKISEIMPDAEVFLDVGEDMSRYLEICEIIRGDKMVIICGVT